MASRFSTGLRNKMLSERASVVEVVIGTTISFSSGTGADGRDQILDSGDGLAGIIDRGFVRVDGSASNDGSYEVLSVAAGVVEVAAGVLTNEAAGATVVLSSAAGGSMADVLRNGVIDCYSGSQPASADDAEIGTLLVTLTRDGQSFTPGNQENGINLNGSSNGVVTKSSETWSGDAVASGTLGWFRFRANDATTGASTTAARADGLIATSGSQLNVPNVSIAVGENFSISSGQITLPTA